MIRIVCLFFLFLGIGSTRGTADDFEFFRSVKEEQPHITSLLFTNRPELQSLEPLKHFFPNLKSLSIERCLNVADLPGVVSTLAQLERLVLMYMGLETVEFLRPLVNLETLSLFGNYALRRIEPLAGLPKLKKLSLVSCYRCEDLEILGRMVQLEGLNLAQVFYDREREIPYPSLNFLVSLQRLTHLSLAIGFMIEDLTPVWEVVGLVSLILSGMDDGECKFADSLSGMVALKSLESLRLGGMINVRKPVYLRELPCLKMVMVYDNFDEIDIGQYVNEGVEYGDDLDLPGWDW